MLMTMLLRMDCKFLWEDIHAFLLEKINFLILLKYGSYCFKLLCFPQKKWINFLN